MSQVMYRRTFYKIPNVMLSSPSSVGKHHQTRLHYLLADETGVWQVKTEYYFHTTIMNPLIERRDIEVAQKIYA